MKSRRRPGQQAQGSTARVLLIPGFWPAVADRTSCYRGVGGATAFERGLMCTIPATIPEYMQEFAVEVGHLPNLPRGVAESMVNERVYLENSGTPPDPPAPNKKLISIPHEPVCEVVGFGRRGRARGGAAGARGGVTPTRCD